MESKNFNAFMKLVNMGDEAALLAIRNEYGKPIMALARIILNDWHYAEDILSIVMATLWNKSKKYQNIEKPKAFIYDLTRKKAISFYRTYMKNPKKSDVGLDVVPKRDASNNLVHEDDFSYIDFFEILSDISEIEQEIITKKFYLKNTFAEIAQDLNMPEGTVKWKYTNILQRLREELMKNENPN